MHRGSVKLFEKALSGSRYLVLLGVVGTLLAAVCLYVGTVVLAVKIAVEVLGSGGFEGPVIKQAAVEFMRVVDLFLIATAFQIISIGMYRLFINTSVEVPGPMAVTSFTELKSALASIVAVVLLIVFLDYVVSEDNLDRVLHVGIAIAAVIIAAGFTIGQIGKSKH